MVPKAVKVRDHWNETHKIQQSMLVHCKWFNLALQQVCG